MVIVVPSASSAYDLPDPSTSTGAVNRSPPGPLAKRRLRPERLDGLAATLSHRVFMAASFPRAQHSRTGSGGAVANPGDAADFTLNGPRRDG